MEGRLTIDSGPLERPRPANIMTNKLDYIRKQILPTLIKHPNGAPFSVPVNHKLLQIPDYPEVIKCAIDLSKIKNRLVAKYYYDANECLSDFEMMFCNCFLYNLSDSEVVVMGLRLEKLFKEKLKSMPSDEYTVNTYRKRGEGGAPKKSRNSGNLKSDISSVGSPPNSVTSCKNQKRMDSCYDMSPTPSPPRGGKNKIKLESDDLLNKRPRLSEDLRLCGTILKELTSVRYRHLNEMFLEPVIQKFPNLPDYLDIIKSPMDLGTIKDNLESYRYKTKEDFVNDITLMFDNCYAYNGLESNVSHLARDLQKIFDESYAKVFKLNKPLVAVTNFNYKVEPIVSPDKSVIEALQKDLKNIVTAVVAFDSKLKEVCDSCGEAYDSIMSLLPHSNGLVKKIFSAGKKRKAECLDEAGNVVHVVHKRGRKSHQQKLQMALMQQQQQQQQHQLQQASQAQQQAQNQAQQEILSSTNDPGAFYTAALISTNTQNHVPPPMQHLNNMPASLSMPHSTTNNGPVYHNSVLPPHVPVAAAQLPIPPIASNGQSHELTLPQLPEKPTEDYTSYEARSNLSFLIQKLSGKQLGCVIDILKRNEAAYNNWNQDELDLDFEKLQPQTMRELYIYVKSIDPPITLEPQFEIAETPTASCYKAQTEAPEEGQISDSSSNSSESSSSKSESSESDSESES